MEIKRIRGNLPFISKANLNPGLLFDTATAETQAKFVETRC